MAAGIEDSRARVAQGPAGFADPVHGAQNVFRTVLEAMSRPGQAAPLLTNVIAPAPLTSSMACVALTMIDQDVTTWLSPAFSGSPTANSVRDYLTFHTGTRIVATPHTAAFVLCRSAKEIPRLATLAQGNPAYPDRSATVIVDALAPADLGAPATLSGPGIEHALSIALPGFDGLLWRQLQDNHAAYPLGVDLIVCTAQGLIGLPRSTKIEVA